MGLSVASNSAGLLSALALTSDSPCVETVLVVCVCVVVD